MGLETSWSVVHPACCEYRDCRLHGWRDHAKVAESARILSPVAHANDLDTGTRDPIKHQKLVRRETSDSRGDLRPRLACAGLRRSIRKTDDSRSITAFAAASLSSAMNNQIASRPANSPAGDSIARHQGLGVTFIQAELFDQRIVPGGCSFPVYVVSSGNVTLMSEASRIEPVAVGRL